MTRRSVLGPSAWLVLFVGAVAAVAACATSPASDLTPDLDPSLPGIDAGASTPSPGMPGGGPADAAPGEEGFTDGDTGAVTPPGTDAASGVDAAPPGPVTPKPTASELLVTEVMFDPTGAEPASEWIELHSLATSARSLGGLTLKDGAGRVHVIAGALTIAPNAWVVLARSRTTATGLQVPAAAIVYEYGAGLGDGAGIQLANGATGAISILNGATVIASAPYGGWFTGSGASVQLKVLTSSAAGSKASWCASSTAWAAGADLGTPGAPNDCP
ncbi:MAG: Hemolysin-type calcium-binding region [Labilithrix sp.]|nr:Hemolysin-type calcium-binding region [Labilithrix sp.]